MGKAKTSEPWIWLQEREAIGAATDCGCRLDAAGPDGEPGAAFYMCPLHAAAPDLFRELQSFVFSYDDETAGDLSIRLQAIIDGARAAIAKAERRDG